mmetsp:Transcript_4739/g.5136  ORF Transcript_4739/g.5136 Transcript_4739/m.5136 type:complete len:100 (+) Transcript_4739:14-313(+)
MDPTDDRMDADTKKSVAKKLFYGGFAMLPLMWLANYLLFYPVLHKRTTPPEVKRYARLSLVLFAISLVVLVVWYAMYALLWDKMGTFGEKISAFYPQGV